MSDVDELVASYSKLSAEEKEVFKAGIFELQERKGLTPKFKKGDKIMYGDMSAVVLSQNFNSKVTTLESVVKLGRSGNKAIETIKDGMPAGTVLHMSSEEERKVGDQILYDISHISTRRGLGEELSDNLEGVVWYWDKKMIKVVVTEVSIVYRINALGEIYSGVTEDKLLL